MKTRMVIFAGIALLLAAAFIVDSEHHQVPVSVPPGTTVPLAARTS